LQANKQTHKPTNKQTNNKQSERPPVLLPPPAFVDPCLHTREFANKKQTNKQAKNTQTNKQTNRQTDRQTDKHTNQQNNSCMVTSSTQTKGKQANPAAPCGLTLFAGPKS
jgi:hypothetical protein